MTQPLPESGGGVLYLANPGRLSKLGRKEPFGAVIIDASHPRTLARLGSLLDAYPIAASPLRIILMPPRGREQILLDAKTWLWDPKAIADLHLVLDGEVQPVQLPTRHYWLSTEADIENQLHEVHRSLAGAMKLVRGVIPAPLLGAWQVYHRFRQMAVPLAYVERARRRLPYVDPLATEIDRIKKTDPQASGDLKVYLDLHWPQIASGLDRLYSLFSDRMEPVKFWVTAQAVDAQFKQSDIPLRVVAGTSEEASLLAELLHDVVDDFGVRFRTGKVQVVHQGGEAKTILHEGHKETVLLGARTSHYRYLDLFHPQPVHVVAYRYEATVDRIVHGRLYDETNSLGTEEH